MDEDLIKPATDPSDQGEDIEIPDPDEFIDPKPTPEQDALWLSLHERVDDDILECESRFIDLSDEAQVYLASRGLAERIRETAVRFNLSPENATKLAAIVSHLFLRRVELAQLNSGLAGALGIEPAQAADVRAALDDVVAQFKRHVAEPAPAAVIAPEVLRARERFAFTPAPQATIPVPPPAPDFGEEPMILHREEPLEERREMPSFTFKPPAPPPPGPPPEEPKPVSVRIETPGAKNGKPLPKSRVVHYSNLRTPLEETDAK